MVGPAAVRVVPGEGVRQVRQEETRSHALIDAFGSFIDVFRVAGRLLWRYWPIFLALTLAGATLRAIVLWIATLVSRWNGLAAVLVVPLAPIATLLAIVMMLRLAGAELPAFAEQLAVLPGRAKAKRDLTVAAQVLIPFLAVYATQGLLAEDSARYRYDSSADEFARMDLLGSRWNRVDYSQSLAIVLGLVIVVLLARKLMSHLKLAEKSIGWAALGGYLEALWLVAFLSFFTDQLNKITTWILSRQVIASLSEWVISSLGKLGVVGEAVMSAVSWLAATLIEMGSWIVIPVAWLAIGAAIFGTKLDGKVKDMPTHEQVTEQIKKVPTPVRRVIAQATEPVTTPIRNTVDSIERVAVAGIIPMFLFCVIFVLADQLRVLVVWIMKMLIGPQEMYARAAIDPYYDLASRTVFTIAIIVLVASAVNVLVLAQRRRDEADAAVAAARRAIVEDEPVSA